MRTLEEQCMLSVLEMTLERPDWDGCPRDGIAHPRQWIHPKKDAEVGNARQEAKWKSKERNYVHSGREPNWALRVMQADDWLWQTQRGTAEMKTSHLLHKYIIGNLLLLLVNQVLNQPIHFYSCLLEKQAQPWGHWFNQRHPPTAKCVRNIGKTTAITGTLE